MYNEELAKKLVLVARLLEKAKGQLSTNENVSPELKTQKLSNAATSTGKAGSTKGIPSVNANPSKKDPIKQANQIKNVDFKEAAIDKAKEIKEIAPIVPANNSPKKSLHSTDTKMNEAYKALNPTFKTEGKMKSKPKYNNLGQWRDEDLDKGIGTHIKNAAIGATMMAAGLPMATSGANQVREAAQERVGTKPYSAEWKASNNKQSGAATTTTAGMGLTGAGGLVAGGALNRKKKAAKCEKTEGQLKLKDIKGTGLSRKDKKALDPNYGTISSPATFKDKVKAGAGLVSEKIKTTLGKTDKGGKVQFHENGQWTMKTEPVVKGVLEDMRRGYERGKERETLQIQGDKALRNPSEGTTMVAKPNTVDKVKSTVSGVKEAAKTGVKSMIKEEPMEKAYTGQKSRSHTVSASISSKARTGGKVVKTKPLRGKTVKKQKSMKSPIDIGLASKARPKRPKTIKPKH